MWGRVVMVQRYPQRKSVSRWLEYAIYFVLFTLLTNAFLGMWARLREGPEALGLASAEGDPITRFLLLGAYLLAISWGMGSLPKVVRLFLRAPLLVILLAWTLASMAWSEAPDVSFRRVVAVILGTLAAAILVVRLNFWELLSLLAWVFLVSLGASFLVGVALPELGRAPEPRGEPWVGVFAQKNMLGRVALLGSLVFFWLLLRGRHRIFWGAALFLALFLLYESESRTAQILFLVAILWMGTLVLARRLRRVWPAYLAALVLLVGGAGVGLVANLETIAQLTGRDLTLTGRVPLWEIVWGYIQDRPLLGYGYGSFWLEETYGLAVSALAGWSVPHSHNGYLDLWLDLGLVGFGLGLLLLLATLGYWWRAYMRTGAPEPLFWLVVWAFFFMYNFAESGFVRSNNLLWLLLAQMYLRRFAWSEAKGNGRSQSWLGG
jgi:exopolysaccharide production protein ExoQ